VKFLSVCSGIEAASVAWNPLGWEAAGFSEIEKFPSAVLAHHYPDVPNYGDLTKWKEWGIERESVDLICGGTPCQSFSVAGLRKGLADPRGNLMLVYLGLVERVRPRWVVWENVPGVLSSNGGRDFGTFLGALGKLGYGWSYRVLDAQYVRVDGFGRAVPQRRRRVFVVGHLGNWQRAASVLFERDCLSGNPAPRREAGKGFAADACPSLTASGRGVERAGETRGQDPVVAVSDPLTGFPYADRGASDEGKLVPTIGNTLRGEGFDASEDGTGRQTLVPEVCGALCDGAHNGGGLNGQDAYSGRILPVVGKTCANCADYGLCITSASPGDSCFDWKPSRQKVTCAPVSPCMTAGGAPFERTGNERTECEAIIAVHGTQDPCTSKETAFSCGRNNGGENVVAIHDKATRHKGGGDSRNGDGAGNGLGISETGEMYTLTSGDKHAVAFSAGNLARGEGPRPNGEVFPTFQATAGDQHPCISSGMSVRRLTPVECERLMGFPDNYTRISWRGKEPENCPDGPRYKALGNSWAVNCARWVGTRIQMVDEIQRSEARDQKTENAGVRA